jgi:hypothetical protein
MAEVEVPLAVAMWPCAFCFPFPRHPLRQATSGIVWDADAQPVHF